MTSLNEDHEWREEDEEVGEMFFCSVILTKF